MSLDEDVEKVGGLATITEIAGGDHVPEPSTLRRSRSRRRSRSNDIKPATESRSRSRRRSRSGGRRRRSRAPSGSPRPGRSPSSRQGRGRDSLDSTRIRRRRGESPHAAPPAAAPGAVKSGHQMPPSHGHIHGSTQTDQHLDCAQPGDWVLGHHRNSLIIRLDDPKVGLVRSAVNAILAGIRNVMDGKRKTSAPPASSSDDGMRFRISFAEVQRMRIRKLQCQMVRHVVQMRLNDHESAGWEETLEKYIKALQDHDYMEKRSKSIRDPFLATGEYAIDNYVLNSNIHTGLASDPDIRRDSSLRTWEYVHPEDPTQNYEPICGTRSDNITKTWWRNFKERIALATIGGALLIGPMWLMVLKGGLFTHLISTTAFVAGFGVLLAYYLEEAKDVLAGTAAYAAVLVVFVGTSSIQ